MLTTHEWLARRLAAPLGLELRPLPFDAPPIRASMLWHARSHDDPIHQWLRQTLFRLSREAASQVHPALAHQSASDATPSPEA